MMNMKQLVLALVGLLLTLSLGLNVFAQSDPSSTKGLDFTFLIDNSSSMVSDSTSQNLTDAGLKLLLDQNSGATIPATDPLGVRFDIVRYTTEWMATFAEEQASRYGNIALNAQVWTFTHDKPEQVVEWTELLEDNLSSINFNTPATNPDGATSDFIEAFNTIGQTMKTKQDETGHDQILVIITDSIPCEVNADAANNADPLVDARLARNLVLRGGACGEQSVPEDHLIYAYDTLEGIIPSSRFTQYVYHINNFEDPNFATAYWEVDGGDILEEWKIRVRQGVFRNTTPSGANLTPNNFGSVVFEDIATELAQLLEGAGSSTQMLGLIPVEPNRLRVPPYQRQLDLFIFSPNESGNITFTNESGNTIVPTSSFDSAVPQLTWHRFEQPPAGQWTVSGQIAEMWMMYSPAEVTLKFDKDPTEYTQYDSLQVIYEIGFTDDEGTYKTWTEPNYLPLLTAEVTETATGNKYKLDITDGSLNFISEQFYLLKSDNYDLVFSVASDPAWGVFAGIEASAPLTTSEEATPDASDAGATEEDAVSFNFLTPPETRLSIDVKPVEIRGRLGTPEQQQEARSNGNVYTIRRSQLLDVNIDAYNINDEAVGLPQGAEVILRGEGDACPGMEQTLTRDATSAFAYAPGGLGFEVGECALSAEVRLTGNILPLTSGTTSIIAELDLGSVEVLTTNILSIEILDRNGNPFPQGEDKTHYQMMDLSSVPTLDLTARPLPIVWQPQVETFEVRFLNQDGDPTHLIFENGEDLVPFVLTVASLDNPDDVPTTFTMEKRDRKGYYSANLTGLQPGEYQIQLTLLRDDADYMLDSVFEYDGNIKSDDRANPVYRANLVVTRNGWIDFEIYTTYTLLGLLIAWIIYAVVDHRLKTVAPLIGQVLVYRQVAGEPAQEILRVPFDGKRNRHDVERTKLLDPIVGQIPIDTMRIYTKRDNVFAKRGGAYVKMNLRAGDTGELRLDPDQPKLFKGEEYYVVKSASFARPPDEA
ncbi:MAG: hypothetical protein ACOYLB_16780 [Phototrophicaceae bacterium]